MCSAPRGTSCSATGCSHACGRSDLLRKTILGALFLLPLAAAAGPFAYVANEKSGTLSVIDTDADRVVGEIPAGKKPRGTAPSPDGRTLYVSDQTANALLVIDVDARKVAGTIPLGESPEGVGISVDGKLIAAASELANAVILIDAAKRTVLATIKNEDKNPEHTVFSPGGRWLYVSAEDASQVDVIDVRERRQVNRIEV